MKKRNVSRGLVWAATAIAAIGAACAVGASTGCNARRHSGGGHTDAGGTAPGTDAGPHDAHVQPGVDAWMPGEPALDAGPSGCGMLGANCTSIDTCCTGADSCRSYGGATDPAAVCCKEVGHPCSAALDCCGELLCTGGVCVCGATGALCANDTDCCSGHTCGVDGTCS